MTAAGDADIECWNAHVRGRVQGVGYRDACIRQAEALGLTGWVRNRLDGSVETLLLGPRDRLAQMVDWLRRGPPAARVEDVDVTAATPPQPLLQGFERRPTA